MQPQFRIFRALGLSFRSWFLNFVPFTLLTAVLYSPVVIWMARVDPEEAETADQLVDMLFMRPMYLLIGLSALLAPLLTYRVIQELNGTTVSMWTSIKLGLRGFLPALILAVATNLLQEIPLGAIIALILTCIFFVAAPAAVAEKLGPIAALARSGALTRGRRLGIFGLLFLLGIVMYLMLKYWIVPMMMAPDDEIMASLKQAAIIIVIVTGVFQMFIGIVEAVSYALLRQDKEGVTHEQLAAVFE